MNKKLTALTLLIMAFVGFTIAVAASAYPSGGSNKIYTKNASTPWDDIFWEYTFTEKPDYIDVDAKISQRLKSNNKQGFVWYPLYSKHVILYNIAYKKHWYSLKKTKFVRIVEQVKLLNRNKPITFKTKIMDAQSGMKAANYFTKYKLQYIGYDKLIAEFKYLNYRY